MEYCLKYFSGIRASENRGKRGEKTEEKQRGKQWIYKGERKRR